MGHKRSTYRDLVRKSQGENNLEDVETDGRIVLDRKVSRLAVLFIFNYAPQPFRAYCAIWVRLSNFRHQASPRESTQRRKVELWARNVR
jgi:hypothetical protein